MIKEILHVCNIFTGKRISEKSKLKLAKKLEVKTILTKETTPVKAVGDCLK